LIIYIKKYVELNKLYWCS